MKLSYTRIQDENSRNEFRRLIRKESDIFRHQIISCWNSLNVSIAEYDELSRYTATNNRRQRLLVEDINHDRILFNMNPQMDPQQLDDQWVNEGLQNPDGECGKVFKTYLWQKGNAIKRALPWFDFSDLFQRVDKSFEMKESHLKNSMQDKHAFRLLTLELWCHLYNHIGKLRDATYPVDFSICSHKNDVVSRLEYF